MSHVSLVYVDRSRFPEPAISGHPADVLTELRSDMHATASDEYREKAMRMVAHAIENGGGVVKVSNGKEETDTYIVTVNS